MAFSDCIGTWYSHDRLCIDNLGISEDRHGFKRYDADFLHVPANDTFQIHCRNFC